MSAHKFFTEIRQQPRVLSQCLNYFRKRDRELAQFLGSRVARRPVFTGMGASLCACLPAVYYLNERGIAARAVETGELAYHFRAALSPLEPLVVISQSGETVEVRRLLDHLGSRPPPLVAITNQPSSFLGRRADLVLPLHSGEQVCASTKGYSASVLMALFLAALWTEKTVQPLLSEMKRSLPAYGRVLAQAEEKAREMTEGLSFSLPVILLSRGAGQASAHEGALLFKEVCAMPAEAMSSGQFRHGPMELLAQELLIILFARAGELLQSDKRLAREIVRRGGKLVWVSSERLRDETALSFRLPRLSCSFLLPLFEIPFVQFLTGELALRRGREPGRLRIAQLVTKQE